MCKPCGRCKNELLNCDRIILLVDLQRGKKKKVAGTIVTLL